MELGIVNGCVVLQSKHVGNEALCMSYHSLINSREHMELLPQEEQLHVIYSQCGLFDIDP